MFLCHLHKSSLKFSVINSLCLQIFHFIIKTRNSKASVQSYETHNNHNMSKFSVFNNNTTVFLFLHMNTDDVMFVAHVSMKLILWFANIGTFQWTMLFNHLRSYFMNKTSFFLFFTIFCGKMCKHFRNTKTLWAATCFGAHRYWNQ